MQSGQLEQILGRELQRYRQEKGWSQETEYNSRECYLVHPRFSKGTQS